ncbi:MAG: DNA/RNA nuclease SfsA [Porticoccus sp.]|nr:DNA/RNA nuclease SfsA [Porticoccus sp.]
MYFSDSLLEGRLIKRYKRFLADVELANGEVLTAHTSNTGAMAGCSTPGGRVWLSRSDNPKRKYPHTWEVVEVAPDVLCGINTLRSNHLVAEAIETSVITELLGYSTIRREVNYGEERSRIDLLLEAGASGNKPPCYVEVKNVTLVEQGVAYFPDAVTVRGTKHLRELMAVVNAGMRAVIFFCVQRDDCSEVRPADDIDSEYGRVLREAIAIGVEAVAYQAKVGPEEIRLVNRIPVVT